MCAKKSSTYLTGGGGFNFEDQVASHYLVLMLNGCYPLGDAFGPLSRVLWQGADVDWQLDDLVLVGGGTTPPAEAGMSIKSDAHLTGSGFSRDFVERCWHQYRGEAGRPFQSEKDLLCVGVATLSAEVGKAWRLLLNQALAAAPERIVARLESPEPDEGSQASKTQRAILRSLVEHAPGDDKPAPIEAVNLLKCIRVLSFDFLSRPSQMEDLAVSECQRLLESGDRSEAVRLWNELLTIAKDFRATGGDLRREDLLSRLSSAFSMRARPNVMPHLARWCEVSVQRLSLASWGLPDMPALPRASLIDSLSDRAAEGRPVLVMGETGSGKTALVRHFCETEQIDPYILDDYLLGGGGPLVQLRLQNCPYALDELLLGQPRRAALIIDATERFGDDELNRTCQLVSRVAGLAAAGRLTILVTCQPDGIERLVIASERSNVPVPVLLPVAQPEPDEIRDLLAHSPFLQHAARDDALVRVLANLKVLELASRAAAAGAILTSATAGLPTALVDFLWRHWIERGGRMLVRGGLLQKLAVAEVESLVAGTPIHRLDASELERVPELINDGLLAQFDERLRFGHDLVGDWSRLRVLIAEAGQRLDERSTNFLWRRAVRLYAQRLAESDPTGEAWLAAFVRTTGSPSQALLMDGFLSACGALPHLADRILPGIQAAGGAAICLLLRRLHHIATRIDSAWRSTLPASAHSMPGPWHVPEPAIWTPILSAIDREPHWPSEIFNQLATSCAVLLHRQCIVGDLPTGLLRLSAQLSLRMGRAIIDDETDAGEIRRGRGAVYEALLLAAVEFPTEVAEAALIAAGRRRVATNEPGSGILEPAEESESGEGGEPAPPLDPELAEYLGVPSDPAVPWPDRPAGDLDEFFRDVCLDTDALIPLIKANPAVAKEVLLACSIEEPRFRGSRVSWGRDDHIGLVHRIKPVPPLYNRGPFLDLFSMAPDTGVDLLVCLVNFATDRWRESPVRERMEELEDDAMFARLAPVQCTVPLENGPSLWFGNANMYCWSLGGLPSNDILTAVLMSCEFWLYRKLEDGRDVTRYLERMLREGHSVGLAGMLVDVGKRHPNLFLGPLRPLLGCWVYLIWDRVVRMQRANGSEGLIGWALRPYDPRRQEAVCWHNARHRARDLLRIAQTLFVNDATFRAFMEDCRRSWEHDFDSAGRRHNLRHLAAAFDWANYRQGESAEEAVIYETPAELVAEFADQRQQADDQQHMLIFPSRCRRILDANEPVSAEVLSDFWDSLRRIENTAGSLFSENFPSRREDGLAAGAAVLVRQGLERLTEEQQRRCREILERLVVQQPRRSPFDVPESVGNRTWDYFVADLANDYLCSNPDDSQARIAVARGIMAYHYGALEHTMNLACARRQQLGGLFPSLVHMVFRWASLREVLRRVGERVAQTGEHFQRAQYDDASNATQTEQEVQSRTQLEREHALLQAEYERICDQCDEVFRQFCGEGVTAIDVRQLMRESIGDLESITRNTRCRVHYPARRRSGNRFEHEDIGLDLNVLRCGFAWLDLRQSDEPAERALWIGWIQDLVTIQCALIPDLAGNQRFASHGYGHDFDTWMYVLLARNTINTAPGEPAIDLWRHMLDHLHVSPEQLNSFLQFWFAAACDDRPEPDSFADRWMEMVAYAVQHPTWAGEPGANDPSRLWSVLLGGNLNCPDGEWVHQLASSLHHYESLILEATEIAVRRMDTMGQLAVSFRQPAWRYMRLALLAQLARWVRADPPSADEFPGDEVASFLARCWDEHEAELKGDAEFARDFQFLLSQANAAGSLSAESLSELVAERRGNGT